MTVTKAQLDLLRETSNSWLDSHDSDDGEFDEYSVALAMRRLSADAGRKEEIATLLSKVKAELD